MTSQLPLVSPPRGPVSMPGSKLRVIEGFMAKHSTLSLTVAVFLSALFVSCTASRTTSFLHPEFAFAQVERVAVVPFENLSSEQGISNYTTRVFLTELLATGSFDIVEPGEVTRVVGSLGTGRGAELSLEQLKKVGKDLNVQAVIFGTVGESADVRSNSGVNAHVVSLDVRMVDTEAGTTIWSAVVNTSGPGLLSRLVGAGDQTRGTSIRKAVRKAIATLIK